MIDDGDQELTGFMAGVHPLTLVWFGCGGRGRERRSGFLLLSNVDKPVVNTGVSGLRIS